MRPIHLIAGVGVIATAFVLFTGVKTPVSESAAPAVGRCQEPICGDAQCVPSVLGDDQFEGVRPRNKDNQRRYLFPRLHKKTGIEGDN